MQARWSRPTQGMGLGLSLRLARWVPLDVLGRRGVVAAAVVAVVATTGGAAVVVTVAVKMTVVIMTMMP